jgi:hypothetical protein
MAADHVSPGEFRAELHIPGPPAYRSCIFEVGAATSPEAALERAVQHWRSNKDAANRFANSITVHRWGADGAIEKAISSLRYLGPDWLEATV